MKKLEAICHKLKWATFGELKRACNDLDNISAPSIGNKASEFEADVGLARPEAGDFV